MTKLALITGGQRGIGFGVAEALIADGWHLAIAAPLAKDSDEVLAALKILGANAHYYQFDLRELSAISPLLEGISQAQGQITSLICNAGVGAKIRGDMLNVDPANYDFAMDINLKGNFFLAQAVAKQMLEQGSCSDSRSFVFVTSVSAQMVSIERAEYCISKAGAGMMAQLFAARLAEVEIGVFDLRPGIIQTDMTAGVEDKYSDLIDEGLVPAKKWGKPDDVGKVVLPLVNGQMSFATGAIIPVDGGLSIHRF